MVCSSVEAISIRFLIREKLEKIVVFQVLRGCGRHAHNLDNVPLTSYCSSEQLELRGKVQMHGALELPKNHM